MIKEYTASPMLLQRSEPFNSKDYIFEVKFDGARTLAYVGDDSLELRSRNNNSVTYLYPELKELSSLVSGEVILDGEVVVLKNGSASFSHWQQRAHLKNEMQIKRLSKTLPAHYVVFDILYHNGKWLTSLPLMQRKEQLAALVKNGQYVTKTTFIEEHGVAFFNLAKEQNLEGVVAKEKSSPYLMGERTKYWLKIKNYLEEDLLVVGYQEKQGRVVRLILAEDKNSSLLLRGSVAGLDKFSQAVVKKLPKIKKAHFNIEDITWVRPVLVANVKYSEKTSEGGLRQPIFNGFK